MMIKTRLTLLCAASMVVALAACDLEPEQAPPFTVPGNGSIVGQVFFDANGDGRYDPVQGDTALSGAFIDLSARGDSARVLLSTTSNAQGTFNFSGVPTGTHEIRARIASGQVITCSPVPVSVAVNEQAFASAPLRVSCRIDIVVAESRPTNSVVTVGGIVTAAPGVYRPNNGYIQDVTGGIQIFGGALSTSSGIVEGDSIEATGTLIQFSSEFELSPTSSFRIVSRNRPIDTVQYTVKQIRDSFAVNSQRSKPIGQLVRIRGVRLRGVPASPTLTGTQVPGQGGTDFRIVQGTDSIAGRFDVLQNVQANIDAARPDTDCYDIVGLLGQFGSTIQLKPRRPSDITRGATTCTAN